MAKNLKIKIKNEQIAAAVKLGGLKEKLAKKKAAESESSKEEASKEAKKPAAKKQPAKPATKASNAPNAKSKAEAELDAAPKTSSAEEAKPKRRVKARSRSVFAETESSTEDEHTPMAEETEAEEVAAEASEPEVEEVVAQEPVPEPEATVLPQEEPQEQVSEPKTEDKKPETDTPPEPTVSKPDVSTEVIEPPTAATKKIKPKMEKLGPTGRHVRDLIPPKPKPKPKAEPASSPSARPTDRKPVSKVGPPKTQEEDNQSKKPGKPGFKQYRDLKPARPRQDRGRSFDARARHGLRVDEEQSGWRRRRQKASRQSQEIATIRPKELSIRLPTTLKDLASEMKLKASQLIEKLFQQGVIVTINDYLDDPTTVQLLGEEFECKITIDTAEEERIRITDKNVQEEIRATDDDKLTLRPPIVTFMGHVDHGKTSLIDKIRETNVAQGEAGAITQHIGAFQAHTKIGDLTIIDTPGHEAFSAMRARGTDVTDIVVLVVAGDEGIRAQTVEAIQHARAAGKTIVVALNKCDKPNFNTENAYRQLAEQELLPEAWGGQIICVNTSAATGEGIEELLEMLALQAEVLELRANPDSRARGSVIESEMHKGLGATASILILNGTLKRGDAVVFNQHWGRVKTMRDGQGKEQQEAGPSNAVEITGLSGLPEAGEEFIVVQDEKEAREIAEARHQELSDKRLNQQSRPMSVDTLMLQAQDGDKKILNIVLRADVRGSLEAVKTALERIESDKAELNIVFTGVGEVSESDVQLAAASGAMIMGYHTQIESHAESLIRQMGVDVRIHDVIYHAVDDAKRLMSGLLDKLAREEDRGKAQVIATFRSSQVGVIAGCQITEGTITRNHRMRVVRNGEVIWKGPIGSLRRLTEDVREVQKGFECGIVLNGFNQFEEGDILESYEVTYITQEL